MKNIKSVFISGLSVGALLLSFLSCSHNKQILNNNQAKKDGLVSIEGIWLKQKSEKFDLELRIANLSEKGLVILKKDLTCGQGERKGKVKLTMGIEAKDNKIYIPSLGASEGVITCEFSQKPSEGDLYFGLGSTYNTLKDNPLVEDKLILSELKLIIKDEQPLENQTTKEEVKKEEPKKEEEKEATKI